MKAILYKTDGTETEVFPVDGKEFQLEEMYRLIDCEIVELVQLGNGVDLWCDEEGLMKSNWMMNVKATELYREAHPDIPPQELGIVGNALFVDNTK